MTLHPDRRTMTALMGGLRTLVVSPARRADLGLPNDFIGFFVGLHTAIDKDHLPPELQGVAVLFGHCDSEGTASFAVLSIQQLDLLEAKLPELRAELLAEERAQGSVQ